MRCGEKECKERQNTASPFRRRDTHHATPRFRTVRVAGNSWARAHVHTGKAGSMVTGTGLNTTGGRPPPTDTSGTTCTTPTWYPASSAVYVNAGPVTPGTPTPSTRQLYRRQSPEAATVSTTRCRTATVAWDGTGCCVTTGAGTATDSHAAIEDVAPARKSETKRQPRTTAARHAPHPPKVHEQEKGRSSRCQQSQVHEAHELQQEQVQVWVGRGQAKRPPTHPQRCWRHILQPPGPPPRPHTWRQMTRWQRRPGARRSHL